jgi:alkylhydroperoxidase family enzyme
VDATPDPVRLPPLPPEQWPAEMKDALAALRPPAPRHPLPRRDEGRPKGLNVLGLLARHPALTRAYHTLNGHVLFATTLSPRERELLVLRVAAVRGSEYEWAQHVVQGGDAGLTPEEIDRIAQGSDSPGWSRLDRALLRAVDELIAEAKIGDQTWEELAGHFDDQQLMDLIFTVGAYETLAMFLRSAGVALDDDLRPYVAKA